MYPSCRSSRTSSIYFLFLPHGQRTLEFVPCQLTTICQVNTIQVPTRMLTNVKSVWFWKEEVMCWMKHLGILFSTVKCSCGGFISMWPRRCMFACDHDLAFWKLHVLKQPCLETPSLVLVCVKGEFDAICKCMGGFSVWHMFIVCIIPQTNTSIISIVGLLHVSPYINVWTS